MRRTLYIAMLLGLTFIAGCANFKANKEEGKAIPVSQVPKAAMDVVHRAAPGIDMTEAEVEKEDGQTLYTVKGKAPDGKVWELEVTPDGRILELNTDAEGKGAQSEKSK